MGEYYDSMFDFCWPCWDNCANCADETGDCIECMNGFTLDWAKTCKPGDNGGGNNNGGGGGFDNFDDPWADFNWGDFGDFGEGSGVVINVICPEG